MTGHEILLTLRLRGQKPSDVFVMVLDTEPVKRGFHGCRGLDQLRGLPEIDISSSDVPNLLDLRCLRGCGFTFCGCDAQRRAVANRVRDFRTSEILAVADGSIIVGNPSHKHDFSSDDTDFADTTPTRNRP